MSYARFGADSDVYIYCDCAGDLRCCGCKLDEVWSYYSTSDMLAHLDTHRAAGHTVPDYCYEGLREEAEENDTWLWNWAVCREQGHDFGGWEPEPAFQSHGDNAWQRRCARCGERELDFR